MKYQYLFVVDGARCGCEDCLTSKIAKLADAKEGSVQSFVVKDVGKDVKRTVRNVQMSHC